jgi:hypothetical protein
MMVTGEGSGRNWTSENYHRMLDDTSSSIDFKTSMTAIAFRMRGKSYGAGLVKEVTALDLELSMQLVTALHSKNQNDKKPYNAKLEARTH